MSIYSELIKLSALIRTSGRADRYLQMFKGFEDKAKPEIDWAIKTLDKEDRVIWFLKQYQKAFKEDDRKLLEELKEAKTSLEHLYGLHIPKIDNYKYDNNKSIHDTILDLEEIVAEFQPDEGNCIVPEDGEIMVPIDSKWAWWDLKKPFCKVEGKAMTHCGNEFGKLPGDNVISLREKVSDGNYIPHLTFVLNKGYIGQSKGRKNQKPSKKYHKYIIPLLKDKRIKHVVGGGYDAENNLFLEDFTPEEIKEITDANPSLKPEMLPNHLSDMHPEMKTRSLKKIKDPDVVLEVYATLSPKDKKDALHSITDEDVLKTIYNKETVKEIKEAILGKIHDNAFLCKIYKNLDDKSKEIALGNITDAAFLEKLYSETTDKKLQNKILDSISDEGLLKKLFLTHPSASGQRNILLKIQDQDLLKNELKQIISGKIDSLVTVDELASRIKDNPFLKDMVNLAKDIKMKKAIVAEISDVDLLEDMIDDPKNQSIQKELTSRLTEIKPKEKEEKKEEAPKGRDIVKMLPNITNQAVLKKLFLSEKRTTVKKQILEKITNLDYLAEIATSTKSQEFLKTIVSKLINAKYKNISVWSKIIKNYTDDLAEIAAIVDDKKLLKIIFEKMSSNWQKRDVLEKIDDQEYNKQLVTSHDFDPALYLIKDKDFLREQVERFKHDDSYLVYILKTVDDPELTRAYHKFVSGQEMEEIQHHLPKDEAFYIQEALDKHNDSHKRYKIIKNQISNQDALKQIIEEGFDVEDAALQKLDDKEYVKKKILDRINDNNYRPYSYDATPNLLEILKDDQKFIKQVYELSPRYRHIVRPLIQDVAWLGQKMLQDLKNPRSISYDYFEDCMKYVPADYLYQALKNFTLSLYRVDLDKIYKELTKEQLKDLLLNSPNEKVREELLEKFKDDQKLIEHIAVNDKSNDVRHEAITLIENPEVLKTHLKQKELPKHIQDEVMEKVKDPKEYLAKYKENPDSRLLSDLDLKDPETIKAIKEAVGGKDTWESNRTIQYFQDNPEIQGQLLLTIPNIPDSIAKEIKSQKTWQYVFTHGSTQQKINAIERFPKTLKLLEKLVTNKNENEKVRSAALERMSTTDEQLKAIVLDETESIGFRETAISLLSSWKRTKDREQSQGLALQVFNTTPNKEIKLLVIPYLSETEKHDIVLDTEEDTELRLKALEHKSLPEPLANRLALDPKTPAKIIEKMLYDLSPEVLNKLKDRKDINKKRLAEVLGIRQKYSV